MHHSDSWSNIINDKPTLSLSSLKDVWNYRDLLWMFVKRDIVTNYKQTILGPLWFFIQPILTTAILVIVFGKIAKLAPNNIPVILFYFSGVTVWNYFAECLTKTSTTFKDNSAIFGKVYFPRLIIPLSVIVSTLLKFLIQFILFIIFWIYFYLKGANIYLNWVTLLTPYLILLMGGLALGSGMIITSLTTKYRDLSLLIQFGVQLLMYATPVIQPLSNVLNSKLKYIILANPMTPVIETFRVAFLGTGIFSWEYLGYSTLVMFVFLFIGFYLFNLTEKTFTDTV